MRIVAFISEACSVPRILIHIGEAVEPPPIAPARGPSVRDDEQSPLAVWEAIAQPKPKHVFGQQGQW